MLQTILLVVMILISIALAGVILLQRSEGGALGMGGGPSGFMTARGAGNLLTRATSILAVLFFLFAIALTIAGNYDRANESIVDADAIGALAEPPAGATTTPTEAPAQSARPVEPSLSDLESSLSGGASQPSTTPSAPAN